MTEQAMRVKEKWQNVVRALHAKVLKRRFFEVGLA